MNFWLGQNTWRRCDEIVVKQAPRYSGHRTAAEKQGGQGPPEKKIWNKKFGLDSGIQFQIQLEEVGSSGIRQSWVETSAGAWTLMYSE